MKQLLATVTLIMLLALAAPAVQAAEHGEHEETPNLLNPPTKEHPETVTTAVTTLIIFCVLLAVLGRFAWGPIVKSLNEREARIRKGIKDAETARQQAQAAQQAYESRITEAEVKVRDLLASATRDAERLAAEIRMSAQKESEENKARATREIEAAKKQALTEIYATAAEISTSIAEKILRRSISVDDQRELVNRSLEELQTVKS